MTEKHDRRVVVAHTNFEAARDDLLGLALAERFERINERNIWGAETSVSGVGSVLAATHDLRLKLPALLSKLGVRTLLDAPCGDAQWIRQSNLELERYIGTDIVASLIEVLHAQARTNETFMVSDITKDSLPQADAVLCRDCLVHLSFANIQRAINNIRQTGARWLLTTTFPELEINEDCEDGDWRGLNFEREPFAWGPPVTVIVEGCDEGGASWADKALGVWDLKAL